MRAALLLAASLYAVVGLVIPLSLGVSDFMLVNLNVIGAVLGWTVTVAWCGSRVQAANRRHLLEWTTNLRLLNFQEFEWIVGEMLRREGWDVTETGCEGADGNVDLRARRNEQVCVVQCKRWQSRSVGVDQIRRFAGTLMREQIDPHSGMFVTLSRFTEAARSEAEEIGFELVDGDDLARRIERVRASEPCPTCATPMLLDRSRRGWWLRCPRWAQGCAGKRDLGSEPARALELLMLR